MPSLLASPAAFGANRLQPAIVADAVMVLNAIRDDGCGSSQPDLRAGILAEGSVTVSERGTGQGSVASRLLGNIHLHIKSTACSYTTAGNFTGKLVIAGQSGLYRTCRLDDPAQ